MLFRYMQSYVASHGCWWLLKWTMFCRLPPILSASVSACRCGHSCWPTQWWARSSQWRSQPDEFEVGLLSHSTLVEILPCNWFDLNAHAI